jgi:hypothetical protein
MWQGTPNPANSQFFDVAECGTHLAAPILDFDANSPLILQISFACNISHYHTNYFDTQSATTASSLTPKGKFVIPHISCNFTNDFSNLVAMQPKATPAQSKTVSTTAKPPIKRKRANSAPPSPERPACKAQQSNHLARIIKDSEDKDKESEGEDVDKDEVEDKDEGDKEEVSNTYARIQADRLAESCNKKVRSHIVLFSVRTHC